MELQRILDKLYKAREAKALADNPKIKGRGPATRIAIKRLTKTMPDKDILTPKELSFLKVAKSNAAYHYLGSAYTYGKIGKAFADAMAKRVKD